MSVVDGDLSVSPVDFAVTHGAYYNASGGGVAEKGRGISVNKAIAARATRDKRQVSCLDCIPVRACGVAGGVGQGKLELHLTHGHEIAGHRVFGTAV